jgi:pilus assembly protein Flp/PilA
MDKLHWLLVLIRGTLRQRVWSRNALTPYRATRGQGLVEYALILVLIAIVTIGVITQLGGHTSEVFSKVSCTLDGGAAASSSHPGNPQGGGGGLANNTTTTGGC